MSQQRNKTLTPERTDAQFDEEAADLRAVMSTKEGRRFVWRLMDDAKVFEDIYTGNSDTYYFCGVRALGLRYFHLSTTHCLDLYQVMQAEAINTQRETQSNG